MKKEKSFFNWNEVKEELGIPNSTQEEITELKKYIEAWRAAHPKEAAIDDLNAAVFQNSSEGSDS